MSLLLLLTTWEELPYEQVGVLESTGGASLTETGGNVSLTESAGGVIGAVA